MDCRRQPPLQCESDTGNSRNSNVPVVFGVWENPSGRMRLGTGDEIVDANPFWQNNACIMGNDVVD